MFSRRAMKPDEGNRRVYEGNVYHAAPQYPSVNINFHQSPMPDSGSASPYQVSNVSRAGPPSSAPPPPPVPPAPRPVHATNPNYQSLNRSSYNYVQPHESLWLDKFARRENRGMLRICLIELFLAVLLLAGGIWCTRDTPEYCPYYSAIWSSVVFLVNAVVGAVAAKNGAEKLYLGHLVGSVVCIFVCLASAALAWRNWTSIGTYHHPKVSRDAAFCLLGEHDTSRLSYIFTNMDQYDFKACLFSLKLGVGVNSVQILVGMLLCLLNAVSTVFCLRRWCRKK